MGVIYYGRTPEGQLIYDLAFLNLTDRWLARKHKLPVAVIRRMRESRSMKKLRDSVEKDKGGR
jgi:hypothetical protein